MSGLVDPIDRGASAQNPALVVNALQTRGRPHSSLGPGLPEPPLNLPVTLQRRRHRFDRPGRVVAHRVLNGIHHEYTRFARAA